MNANPSHPLEVTSFCTIYAELRSYSCEELR